LIVIFEPPKSLQKLGFYQLPGTSQSATLENSLLISFLAHPCGAPSKLSSYQLFRRRGAAPPTTSSSSPIPTAVSTFLYSSLLFSTLLYFSLPYSLFSTPISGIRNASGIGCALARNCPSPIDKLILASMLFFYPGTARKAFRQPRDE